MGQLHEPQFCEPTMKQHCLKYNKSQSSRILCQNLNISKFSSNSVIAHGWQCKDYKCKHILMEITMEAVSFRILGTPVLSLPTIHCQLQDCRPVLIGIGRQFCPRLATQRLEHLSCSRLVHFLVVS